MAQAKFKLTLTTDGAGNASARTKEPVNGEIDGIYVDLGTLDAASDITITQNDGEGSLPIATITNATTGWYFPIITAIHVSGSGTPKTDGYMPVVGYITANVASGGSVTTGSVYVFVHEE